MCAFCVKQAQNRERAVSWAAWLKTKFRGHLVHLQPPTFCGFQASDSTNETPRPPYGWSLGGAGGQLGPRTVGAKVFSRPLGMLKQVFVARLEPPVTHFGPWKIPKCLENGPLWDGSKMAQKLHFSKSDPGPFGMLKQVFLPHLEPVVLRFGPWKIPKCLANGPFWNRKWVKKGQKRLFPKVTPDHSGCTNK